MKTLFQKYKWLQIVLGIVLLVAGILAIVFSINNIAVITRVIAIIIAVCCFVFAIMLITASFLNNPRTPFPLEVLIAGIAIGVGITLCIGSVAEGLIGYLGCLVACCLIALGSVAIIKSAVIICYKDPIQNWLIMIICGAVALVGGILMLCYPNEISTAINYIIAALIIALGVFEIILGINAVSKSKKKK